MNQKKTQPPDRRIGSNDLPKRERPADSRQKAGLQNSREPTSKVREKIGRQHEVRKKELDGKLETGPTRTECLEVDDPKESQKKSQKRDLWG